MNSVTAWVFATHDAGLRSHWKQAVARAKSRDADSFHALAQIPLADNAVVWLDLALPGLPTWQDPDWQRLLATATPRIIATNSNPKDTEAIAALDAGCVAYCHAFSESGTLRQIEKVVLAGHVWVGPALMQRLIRGAQQAAPATPLMNQVGHWASSLTPREKEIALLAANAASNTAIADACGISERTVKAHLSAVFDKLGISDRLQLALKVHGIQ
jgi:DNA-binding NarL/FixJ family response regulator